jgi:hypothetical protein
MSWSERINTASSGSGWVDDTEGHLQGEIRGPTKLVKMRGTRWDGRVARRARMRDAVESMEPVEAVRHRQCEALGKAREPGGSSQSFCTADLMLYVIHV